jgi:5'-nucleotidase
VDGTPSDCVNIALAHLLPRTSERDPVELDGVVSGINLGLNTTLGFILASGTVSAAWEGALHGYPAMAFSQDIDHDAFEHVRVTRELSPELAETLRHSADHAARLAGALLPATKPGGFVVHNLNFPTPCRPETGMKATVPAWVTVPRLFSPAADDGTHRFIFSEVIDRSPPDLATDKEAVAAGYISHSILDYTKLGT